MTNTGLETGEIGTQITYRQLTHIVFVENDAKTMHFLCKESVAIGFYDNYEIVN